MCPTSACLEPASNQISWQGWSILQQQSTDSIAALQPTITWVVKMFTTGRLEATRCSLLLSLSHISQCTDRDEEPPPAAAVSSRMDIYIIFRVTSRALLLRYDGHKTPATDASRWEISLGYTLLFTQDWAPECWAGRDQMCLDSSSYHYHHLLICAKSTAVWLSSNIIVITIFISGASKVWLLITLFISFCISRLEISGTMW